MRVKTFGTVAKATERFMHRALSHDEQNILLWLCFGEERTAYKEAELIAIVHAVNEANKKQKIAQLKATLQQLEGDSVKVEQ